MKCKLIGVCRNIEAITSSLKNLPLLFIRLTLAYGFYTPAMNKWQDIGAITSWFESMGYPLPKLNAYMAAGIETLGFILLTIGFATRNISVPLNRINVSCHFHGPYW